MYGQVLMNPRFESMKHLNSILILICGRVKPLCDSQVMRTRPITFVLQIITREIQILLLFLWVYA